MTVRIWSTSAWVDFDLRQRRPRIDPPPLALRRCASRCAFCIRGIPTVAAMVSKSDHASSTRSSVAGFIGILTEAISPSRSSARSTVYPSQSSTRSGPWPAARDKDAADRALVVQAICPSAVVKYVSSSSSPSRHTKKTCDPLKTNEFEVYINSGIRHCRIQSRLTACDLARRESTSTMLPEIMIWGRAEALAAEWKIQQALRATGPLPY